MSKLTVWTVCPLSGKLEYCSKRECSERQERNEMDECKRKFVVKQNKRARFYKENDLAFKLGR